MNHDIRVTIDHVGAKGDGVALVDGAQIFVPLSAPGDELDIVREGAHARIARIVSSGPGRVAPACAHFGRCGGCALQQLDDKIYADWKRSLVVEALGHRGFNDAAVAQTLVSPPNSRRRARFHVLHRGREGVALGFFGRGTNDVVDMVECHVLTPEIMSFLPPLRHFLGTFLKPGNKAAVQVTESDSGLDVWFETTRQLSLDIRMDVADFAQRSDLARVSWGEKQELVTERRTPVVRFGDVPVALPPGAFLQATAAGEKALVAAVLDAAKGAKRVADLFAGCGTFTLPLARHARVLAAEGEGILTGALKRAADMAQGLQEVTVERRDLFRRPLSVSDLGVFDAVVFDPPRVGAALQAQELAASNVATIVAVSCNPATFARDARTLVTGGYVMDVVQPVDQFLWSPHVEMVAVFRKA